MTTMYKVVYRPNIGSSAENMVEFKWFKSFDEATVFGGKLGDKVLEIKQYDKPENFPDAELDLGFKDE